MRTSHRGSVRNHLPLVLGLLAACAFLALTIAIIVAVNSAPEGWYWSR